MRIEHFEQLKPLVGDIVKEIREFYNDSFDYGYLIFFVSGLVLTAQDGEYGDNAFEFIDIEKARGYKVVDNRIVEIA